MSAVSSLLDRLPLFDKLTIAAFVVGIIAASLQILLESKRFPAHKKSGTQRAIAILVIVGAVAAYVAQDSTSEITTAINKIFNKEILDLKVEIELLRGKNASLEDEIGDIKQKHLNSDFRIAATESAQKQQAAKLAARKFSASDLPKIIRFLRRKTVTIVRLEDPEAKPFGGKIGAALRMRSLNIRYEVMLTSSLSGVWVCANNTLDSRIADFLDKATPTKRFQPTQKERDPACDADVGPNAPILPVERGTVVIVSHQPR